MLASKLLGGDESPHPLIQNHHYSSQKTQCNHWNNHQQHQNDEQYINDLEKFYKKKDNIKNNKSY